jgi:glyoxylase-like metal-dependent hydrolase (beta-lactamase superfamily II)
VSGARVIHHLGCGTMCPHGRKLINGDGGVFEKARLVCHCLLVQDDDGLTLIDTGFGLDDMRNKRQLGLLFNALVAPQTSESETAIEHVRALGHQPEDVRRIVLTHLDVDHAGGLPDFPNAEVHVLGRELDAALHPSLRERERYVKVHWAHGPSWVRHEPDGDDWFGFESVRALDGPAGEILLVPLYGHTRGHCGVAVASGDSRWLLHCGDSYFHRDEVRTPPSCPPGLRVFASVNASDNAARKRNVERLRELATRPDANVELLCAHDAVTLDRMRAGG